VDMRWRALPALRQFRNNSLVVVGNRLWAINGRDSDYSGFSQRWLKLPADMELEDWLDSGFTFLA